MSEPPGFSLEACPGVQMMRDLYELVFIFLKDHELGLINKIKIVKLALFLCDWVIVNALIVK